MKYIKLFESFISEPIFFRFSHIDLLNGESEKIYHPKERVMWGTEEVNSSLIRSGFPDKKRCVHFMDSVAFNPEYKGLYGQHIYQVEIDDNSNLGWTFMVPINEWFFKGYGFRPALKNPICKELLDSEYGEMRIYDWDKIDVDYLDKMKDYVIDFGFIGTGNIKDLKSSKFFGNQPVFVWTNDPVRIKAYTYQKPTKDPKPYKNQPILTKMDFEELGIDSNQIPNFYKSDFGRWFKRLKDSVPFEVRREEALKLVKKWKESL
jgi:hypothetical protein